MPDQPGRVQTPERCCGGRCRRAQPPMIMRGGLSDRWYVVLRYKDLGDGNFEAIEKHELHPESVRQLDAMLAAYVMG